MGSVGANDETGRTNELEDHVRQGVGGLFRNEPPGAWKTNEPASGNSIGQTIAKFRADEHILVAPHDHRGTVDLPELDVRHVVLVDRSRESQKVIPVSYTHLTLPTSDL